MTVQFNNSGPAGRAMGIGQAMMFEALYAQSLGALTPQAIVRHNDEDRDSESFHERGNVPGAPAYIQIGKRDWASWDTILHEYAHHVAINNGIDESPTGPHGSGADNITGRNRPGGGVGLGADRGAKLAWSEGFATSSGSRPSSRGTCVPPCRGFRRPTMTTGRNFYSANNDTGRAADLEDLSFGVYAESPRKVRPGRNQAGALVPEYTDSDRLGEGDDSVVLAMWISMTRTTAVF